MNARLALAFIAISTSIVIPALADTRVRFGRILDGRDFADAYAFFQQELAPNYWDTRVLDARQWAPRRTGTKFGTFIQDWILFGKGDVNGDGIEERFYYFDNPLWCGSAGCQLLIVDVREGKPSLLCQANAHEEHVWITDRVTVNGFREIEAAGTYHWHGAECQTDQDELDIEAPAHDALRE